MPRGVCVRHPLLNGCDDPSSGRWDLSSGRVHNRALRRRAPPGRVWGTSRKEGSGGQVVRTAVQAQLWGSLPAWTQGAHSLGEAAPNRPCAPLPSRVGPAALSPSNQEDGVCRPAGRKATVISRCASWQGRGEGAGKDFQRAFLFTCIA